MNIKHQHVDDEALAQLLYENEDSDILRVTAAHVESCSSCERRLAELAASDEFTSEATSLLRGYSSSDSSLADAACKQRRLDFLSPPSHPEMLGRLGRYDIERIVGAGGMGTVLKAFDTELNRPVAIKVLADHLAHRGPARKRFAREAKAAAAVVHEHVVAIHNVEAEQDVPFLVMQFVAGESLQARVDREGPLDAKETLRIGLQVAAGLAAAHEQGVIHRDIKPANILLENGIERVLITDFGLVRTVDDASLTHTGVVAGTPHYMSPEQANGQPTDVRTDLFSLGSVLYFMVTGHPPFRAERAMGVLNRICNDTHRPAWQVNADVPDELSDLIDRLLQKRPSKRFASASEVRETLARLLAKLQQRKGRRRARLASWLRRISNRAFAKLCSGPAKTVLVAIVFFFLLVAAVAIAVTAAYYAFGIPVTDITPDEIGEQPKVVTPNGQPSPRSEVEEALLDTEAISADIQSLERKLNQFEAMSASPSFNRGDTDDFRQQVESMNRRLNQIEGDAFSNFTRPSQ